MSRYTEKYMELLISKTVSMYNYFVKNTLFQLIPIYFEKHNKHHEKYNLLQFIRDYGSNDGLMGGIRESKTPLMYFIHLSLLYRKVGTHDRLNDIIKHSYTKSELMKIHDGLNSYLYNEDSAIILELINTGKSNPGYVYTNNDSNNDRFISVGDTALILACKNKMSDVAVALIKTGQARTKQTNTDGETALSIATKYELLAAVKELENELHKPDEIPGSINSPKGALFVE